MIVLVYPFKSWYVFFCTRYLCPLMSMSSIIIDWLTVFGGLSGSVSILNSECGMATLFRFENELIMDSFFADWQSRREGLNFLF